MRIRSLFIVAALLFLCPAARADERPSDDDCLKVGQTMGRVCVAVAGPTLDPSDARSIRTAAALCKATDSWAANTCKAGAIGRKYLNTCEGARDFTKDSILAGGEEVAKKAKNEAAAKSIREAAKGWADEGSKLYYELCQQATSASPAQPDPKLPEGEAL